MRILVEPSDYSLLNLGDTAMLEVALKRLSALQPDARIEVLTNVSDSFPSFAPNVTPLNSAGRHAYAARPSNRRGMRLRSSGLQSVRRWGRKLFGTSASSSASSAQAFIDHVRSTDLVVVAGMGGITDVFPKFALGVFATLDLAIRHNVPTAMLGQGIGPLTNPDLVVAAKNILPKVDLITLRERRAGEPLLRTLGVTAERILTTGDDAIELAYNGSHVPRHLGRGLGVNLRRSAYAEVDEALVHTVGEAVQRAAERLQASLIPVPVSRYPGEADHITISDLLPSQKGA
jgi:polysaccharide pyruvyl transferase WcaK-like protein